MTQDPIVLTREPVPMPAPEYAPAAWAAAVVELAATHELPRLMIAPAAAQRMAGWLELHPWTLCRDVDALLAWAEHFDHGSSVSTLAGQIHLFGQLCGEPTVLIGVTHRLDDGDGASGGGWVSFEQLHAVRVIERAEFPDPAPAPSKAVAEQPAEPDDPEPPAEPAPADSGDPAAVPAEDAPPTSPADEPASAATTPVAEEKPSAGRTARRRERPTRARTGEPPEEVEPR